MITKEIEINGSKFKIMLTDQVISQVDNLKSLYATAAEDPEIFEDINSQISSTINEIASSVTPEISDSYLDGLIQEVFKAVEDKKSEVENQIKDKDSKITRKKLKEKNIVYYIQNYDFLREINLLLDTYSEDNLRVRNIRDSVLKSLNENKLIQKIYEMSNNT